MALIPKIVQKLATTELVVAFYWDVLIAGGNVGTIDTGIDIPVNAIIYSIAYRNNRHFVSAGGGLVSLTIFTKNIQANQNYAGAPYTGSGFIEMIGRNANTVISGIYNENSTTGTRLFLTITTAPYTDGAGTFVVKYATLPF